MTARSDSSEAASVEHEDDVRRRLYRNPPVAEAIARLQWVTPVPWTITTPGLLYERLRKIYPDEPRAQAVIQASFNTDPGSPQTSGSAGFVIGSGPQRMFFGAQDGSRLIGLSPTDLSVHGLVPYEGWDSLAERLFDAVALVQPVLFETEPMVAVVGLRYINRIEIPENSLSFMDYFTVGYGFPTAGFPEQLTKFLDQAELRYSSDTRINVTWASVEAPAGGSAFVLDFDLYHEPEVPLELSQARPILEDLKKKEGRAFESMLQPRLREQFGEIAEK